MSWVLDHSESRLGARCVLIAIANHADAYGRNAWPRIGTLAREARLSEREVQYALVTLRELGELSVLRGAGPKGTNLYCLPKMGAIPSGAKFASPAQRVVEGCTEPPLGVHTGAPEPSKSEPSNTEPPIVPISVWLEFAEMRKKIRKPLTDRAGELIRNKLAKFKEQGYDPTEILENSIRNGWQDVYEPREGNDGARQTDAAGRNKLNRFEQAAKNVTGRGSQLATALSGDALHEGRTSDHRGSDPVLLRLPKPTQQSSGPASGVPVVPRSHQFPATAKGNS